MPIKPRSALPITTLLCFATLTTGSKAQDNAEVAPTRSEASIPESGAAAAASTVGVDSPAQKAELAPEAARVGSRMVAEIVVTAQKREESLQDVPISIQAFTADTLDAQGVRDLQNLPQITPGLTVTTQVAYTSTYIRGIGSDAFLLADPSVATYFDGIYQPFPNGLVQDFGEIERVEILKGPQGTLFGRNAVGGAINIISRAPDLEKAQAGAQSGYQRYDTFKNRGYLSLPIGGIAAIAVSGVYNDGENHIDGRAGGKPLDPIRSKGGRLQLRIAPADWMDLQVTGFKVWNEGPTTSYQPNANPTQLFGAVIQPQDPYAGAVNEDLFYHHRSREFYGQLSFFTDWLDIKVLGSDQKAHSFFNYDFDSSPQPLALFQIDNVFADVQTAELQFVSNDSSWAAERFKWIVGGYFFQSRTGFDPSFLRVAGTNLSQGILLGAALPDALQATVQSLLSGVPIPNGDINFVGLLGTRSLAGFAQTSIELADTFSLTLGARYQREVRRLIQSSSELRNADGSLTPIQSYRYGADSNPDRGPPLKDVTRSFDPKVAIDFRPEWTFLGHEPLLYASWQTATKSSTYNTVNIYDPPDLVKPEDIRAYEIGIKTTLLDGLMRLNVAGFDYRIKNQQVQFISLLAGGAVTFENAGSVRVKGGEFDLLVELFPNITPGLVMTLGGCFIDPVYSSYPNGSGFGDTGLLTRNNDFSGNQVVRSPKQTIAVGLSQTVDMPAGSLEVGVNFYSSSKFYYSAENNPTAEENAYDTLGVHTSFLVERWNLRLTAFGDNVLGERYSYSKFPSDFGVGDARAPKAVYGFRLGWDL